MCRRLPRHRWLRALLVIPWLVVGHEATAQTTDPAAPVDTPRERLTGGLTINVALEGAGPWFAPGLKLAVPLARRVSIDVESAAVFGGRQDAPAGSITSFLAVNARLLRGTRQPDGTGRYWLAGLRYLPISRRRDDQYNYDADVPGTFGHGWDQVWPSGRRVAAEIAISGGRGYILFATISITGPLIPKR